MPTHSSFAARRVGKSLDTARKSGSPPFGLSLATETVRYTRLQPRLFHTEQTRLKPHVPPKSTEKSECQCKTEKSLISTPESATWQAVAGEWFLESAQCHVNLV